MKYKLDDKVAFFFASMTEEGRIVAYSVCDEKIENKFAQGNAVIYKIRAGLHTYWVAESSIHGIIKTK